MSLNQMDKRSYWPQVACLLLLMASSGGCRHIYPGMKPDGPKPRVPQIIPREHAKVSMPDYIIEPPDILTIETIGLIPKLPYRLKPLDVVSVFSAGLPEDLQLAGEYTIQPNGTIQMGHSLGLMRATGKSVLELQADILDKLKEDYREPEVWVTLNQMGAQQQIAGEHLVAPDGKVNLGTYGRVRVVGLTIDEARHTIQEHLSESLENPEISVDVLGYNSKVYYVITQGAGLGDQVIVLPSKGNETVLDAIGQIQGLQSNSSTRMWIARPGKNSCGGDQILPVDWLAVTQRGAIETNYQVMPGDRIYVSEDKLVAFDTALGKLISPLERIFGATLLGTNTVSRFVFFDRGNNFGGGNF
ncbi:MAG: polysaccharide biosynthesis/export family protein [Pirellulales bacterium]